MPYFTKKGIGKDKGKTCVHKKSSKKKVGCTDGPIEKYLTALRMAESNDMDWMQGPVSFTFGEIKDDIHNYVLTGDIIYLSGNLVLDASDGDIRLELKNEPGIVKSIRGEGTERRVDIFFGKNITDLDLWYNNMGDDNLDLGTFDSDDDIVITIPIKNINESDELDWVRGLDTYYKVEQLEVGKTYEFVPDYSIMDNEGFDDIPNWVSGYLGQKFYIIKKEPKDRWPSLSNITFKQIGLSNKMVYDGKYTTLPYTARVFLWGKFKEVENPEFVMESNSLDWIENTAPKFTAELLEPGQKFYDKWGDVTRVLEYMGKDDENICYEPPCTLLKFRKIKDPSGYHPYQYGLRGPFRIGVPADDPLNTDMIFIPSEFDNYIDTGKLTPIFGDLNESKDFDWVRDVASDYYPPDLESGLKDLERWVGQAYQTDDEIGLSVQDVKENPNKENIQDLIDNLKKWKPYVDGDEVYWAVEDLISSINPRKFEYINKLGNDFVSESEDLEWIKNINPQGFEKSKSYVVDVSDLRPDTPISVSPTSEEYNKLTKVDVLDKLKRLGYNIDEIPVYVADYLYLEPMDDAGYWDDTIWVNQTHWVDYDTEHTTLDPTYNGKYEMIDVNNLMFLLDNKMISESKDFDWVRDEPLNMNVCEAYHILNPGDEIIIDAIDNWEDNENQWDYDDDGWLEDTQTFYNVKAKVLALDECNNIHRGNESDARTILVSIEEDGYYGFDDRWVGDFTGTLPSQCKRDNCMFLICDKNEEEYQIKLFDLVRDKPLKESDDMDWLHNTGQNKILTINKLKELFKKNNIDVDWDIEYDRSADGHGEYNEYFGKFYYDRENPIAYNESYFIELYEKENGHLFFQLYRYDEEDNYYHRDEVYSHIETSSKNPEKFWRTVGWLVLYQMGKIKPGYGEETFDVENTINESDNEFNFISDIKPVINKGTYLCDRYGTKWQNMSETEFNGSELVASDAGGLSDTFMWLIRTHEYGKKLVRRKPVPWKIKNVIEQISDGSLTICANPNTITEAAGISFEARKWGEIIYDEIMDNPNEKKRLIIDGYDHPESFDGFPIDYVVIDFYDRLTGYGQEHSGYDKDGNYVVLLYIQPRLVQGQGGYDLRSVLNHEMKHAWDDYNRLSKGLPSIDNTKETKELYNKDFILMLSDQNVRGPIKEILKYYYYLSKLETTAYLENVYDENPLYEKIVREIASKDFEPFKERFDLDVNWHLMNTAYNIPLLKKFKSPKEFIDYSSEELRSTAIKMIKKINKMKYVHGKL